MAAEFSTGLCRGRFQSRRKVRKTPSVNGFASSGFIEETVGQITNVSLYHSERIGTLQARTREE
jgi:hypothetical protein